jgi:choline dehydrogenase
MLTVDSSGGMTDCCKGAALEEFLKREAWGHHASCSCPIGAVLDSEFRVLGTSNLRVVDASVFPRIPGTFVLLPTYMISEKAAQTILNDNSKY